MISDPLQNLRELTEKQAELLTENGYKTFADVEQADVDEIASLPTINDATAESIISESSAHVDPKESLWRKCFKDESQDFTTKGGVTEDVVDDKDVTALRIPSGEPRSPADTKNTVMSYRVQTGSYSLATPILKKPTFTIKTLTELADEFDDFRRYLIGIEELTAFNIQAEALLNHLEDEFDNLDDLISAGTEPRSPDRFIKALTAPGITKDRLKGILEELEPAKVSGSSPREVAQTVDRQLIGDVPTQSRMKLGNAIASEIDHGALSTDLTEDDRMDDLLAASEAPIQINHPQIPDTSELPDIRTRPRKFLADDCDETCIEAADKIFAYNDHPLDLVGHAGVGKETIIKYLCGLTNRPVLFQTMDESILPMHVLGENVINENEIVEFQYGPMPHTAKYGWAYVMSESNAAAPEILAQLHAAMETDAKIYIRGNEEMLIPSERWRMACTRNPPLDEYSGTKEMNDAFQRRQNSVWIPYLPVKKEVELLDEMVNDHRTVMTKEEIKALVQTADKFRAEYAQPRGELRISTTDIKHIIQHYDGVTDLTGATIGYLVNNFGRYEFRNHQDVIPKVRSELDMNMPSN
jgi:MoxR-like ATPase